MKIRNGFVSNSSSSSFVILGFKTKYLPEVPEKFQQLYVESDEYDYIVGHLIAEGDDNFDGELSNIGEKIQEISEEFNKDMSEIKIYSGIRPT